MKRIRRKIEEDLGDDAQSRKKLRQVFSDIDRDGSSSIDKRELKKALEILKVEIRSADLDALFDRFDSSGDGHIDYGEFLQLVGFMSEDESKPKKKKRKGVSDEEQERLEKVHYQCLIL